MTRFSVGLLNEYKNEYLVEIAKEIDVDENYKNLFVADERLYRNTYSQLAIVAENTDRIGIGTGVTNPYTRNPAITAASISTISELSEGRAILGLGAGSPMILDQLGISQKHSIETMRDTTYAIKELNRGNRVTMESKCFSMKNAELNFVSEYDIPVFIAGRGPKILALGGEIGDGVIAGAGLSSVPGMNYARENIDKGIEISGMNVDVKDTICWAFLSVAGDRDTALESVIDIIIRIVHAVPIKTLEAIGIPKKDVNDLKNIGDIDRLKPQDAREMVTDGIINQFAIAGTLEECCFRVEELINSGVEHIAVLPFENQEYMAKEMLRQFSENVVEEVK